MSIKIALAGNPNCGKTTLFNVLTGSNQYVGNWPGVTVEKKEGVLKGNKEAVIVDLPGIYSLSPYTMEEVVAREYLVKDRPQVIINVVDGTNIERNLYLSTQLMELGIPVVIAINMMDVVRKKGDVIDIEEMSLELGCPIVEVSALKGEGIEDLINSAINQVGQSFPPQMDIFTRKVEQTLYVIEGIALRKININLKRWYSIKVFERDSKIIDELNLSHKQIDYIEHEIVACENSLADDSESIITNDRYNYVTVVVQNTVIKNNNTSSVTDKIDNIVTNRYLALPIFGLVMFVVYFLSVTTVGAWITNWCNEVLFGTWVPNIFEYILVKINCANWLQELIINGILAGVGAVLSFVPQLFLLFAMLAFLEGCGYMSRIAFILDRLFRKIGLSGKSFIPILVGTGCGVSGIMCSRTIENEKNRRMTIVTTTFIPCGAKLPVIALIAGSLFNGTWWVAPGAYLIGIFAIVMSGVILNKTKPFISEETPFVMELPQYHMPTLINILRSMWERGWDFIKKAGTVILLSSMIIWLLSNFGIENGSVKMVEDISDGFIAQIGKALSVMFVPLGFGNWQTVVATLTGLAAKENIVSTLGVLYTKTDQTGGNLYELIGANFTQLTGFSFLVFNLLCAPCFAAMAAIKREMNSALWTAFAIGYQTLFAYFSAFTIYQIGKALASKTITGATVLALAIIVLTIYMILRKPTKAKS